MTERVDSQTVQQARAGDPGALADLLTASQGRVYRICRRMLFHPQPAAEVAQAALVEVAERITEHPGPKLGLWIMRIAVNRALAVARRGAAGSNGASSGVNAQLAGLSEPWSEDAAADRSDDDPAESDAEILHALGRVEPDLRVLLVLRDAEQLAIDDIAAILAVPVPAVKTRLFRARLTLRREMLAGATLHGDPSQAVGHG